jgi:hypothetical protein
LEVKGPWYDSESLLEKNSRNKNAYSKNEAEQAQWSPPWWTSFSLGSHDVSGLPK